jgi:hypothetical protein
MGGVTSLTCVRWQGMLAMQAIALLPSDEEDDLDAHLTECDACRSDADELVGLDAAMRRADVHHIDDAPVELDRAAIWEQIHFVRRHVARRRATRMSMALVLAAAAAVVVVAVIPHAVRPSTRTVTLVGAAGAADVRASVTLAGQTSGTKVIVDESGQPSGQVFTVSMETSPSSWWVAGSYRTDSSTGDAHVTLWCAASSSAITGVWINDQAGHTVLRAYVN